MEHLTEDDRRKQGFGGGGLGGQQASMGFWKGEKDYGYMERGTRDTSAVNTGSVVWD